MRGEREERRGVAGVQQSVVRAALSIIAVTELVPSKCSRRGSPSGMNQGTVTTRGHRSKLDRELLVCYPG
eukprot:1158843-Rhodomonas_salina.1